MTRDVAPRLRLSKPALIHCKFFPPLTGRGGKMSGSVGSQAVFMTDTPKQVHEQYRIDRTKVDLRQHFDFVD